MINLITQSSWRLSHNRLLETNFTNLQKDYWTVRQPQDVLKTSVYVVGWDDSFRIDTINRDYLYPRVEISVGTFSSDSYEYQGHTWNPVDSGSCRGNIYNLPAKEMDVDVLNPHENNVYGNPNERLPQFIFLGRMAPPDLNYGPVRASYYGWDTERYASIWYAQRGDLTYQCSFSLTTGRHSDYSNPHVFPSGDIFSHKESIVMNFVTTILAPDAGASGQRYQYFDHYLSFPISVSGYDTPSTLHSEWIFRVNSDYFTRKTKPNYGFGGWQKYFKFRLVSGGIGDPSISLPAYSTSFPDDVFLKNVNWHELAGRAYKSARFSDINGIAGIQDTLSFGAASSSFLSTLRKIPSGRVKAWAQSYLSVHYGFKLFFLDLMNLRDTLALQSERRSSLSRLNAVSTFNLYNASWTARYQVFYDQFAQVRNLVDQALQISDVQLTLENWWDMVPFSFVVDWFIGIGDILSSIDDYANLTQNHEVICCGRSLKGSKFLSQGDIHLAGSYYTSGLTLSRYIRVYQHELLLPSFVPSVTINPFNHSVEGAALIISRR